MLRQNTDKDIHYEWKTISKKSNTSYSCKPYGYAGACLVFICKWKPVSNCSVYLYSLVYYFNHLSIGCLLCAKEVFESITGYDRTVRRTVSNTGNYDDTGESRRAGFLSDYEDGRKSMLEKIGAIQNERKEYKEYIEQWIHEVKTPITAIKLLCENNRSPFAREILAELEHINQYTEQALYYARSEHTEKDYSVRETNLCDVVHRAVADNKYLLRQSNMTITIDDIETKVYTDDKWVRFILNQIIGNAIKYRIEQPVLHFSAIKTNDRVVLAVSDNGIGIPKSDLPRIFEKGFTGKNGRIGKNSTGMGLYLCKRLCDKLGIGLTAHSENKGTTIVLSFQMNDFIIRVQG